MKKIIVTLMLAALSLPFALFAQNPSGRKIAEMADDANHTRNSISWAKLSIIDKGRVVETRRVITKIFRKNKRDRSFFRFMNGLKRNVTMFSIEKGPNQNNLQYLYVPGVGRPRQISSSEKQNDFEDTDLTNENLGGLKINDYRYKRLSDKTLRIAGETYDCYVIIARHKKSSARFPKKKTWIDKKTLVPVRMNVYGRDGRLKRKMIAAKVKQIAANVYTPFYMQVKDLERNHMTKMIITKIKVNVRSLKYRQFIASNISKPWRER